MNLFESEVLRRLASLEAGNIPSNVVRIGNGDASVKRRVEFVTSTDSDTDEATEAVRPGLVYDPTAAAPVVAVTHDGTNSGAIIGAGNINGTAVPWFGGDPPFQIAVAGVIGNLNAGLVSGYDIAALLARANHTGAIQAAVMLPWTNTANRQLGAVPATYGDPNSTLDYLAFPGVDSIGYTPAAAQLIVRYTTGALPALSTFSVRVRDTTTGADIAEVTGLPVSQTNALASAIVACTWPVDSTKDVRIEIKNSAGTPGSTITIQGLTIVAR